MARPINSNSVGAHLDFGKIARFIPEPTNRSGLSFSSILERAGSIASQVAGVATGGQFPGLDSQYVTILQEQIRTQVQMQLMTMYSNTEKSRHETSMTALRNIRVG